jgi:hypothetical protein
MPNEKVSCEVADGDGPAVGESPDGKQRLMLLGRQADPVGGRLAECLKFPKLIAKARKRFVVHRSTSAGHCFRANAAKRPPAFPK